MAPDTPFIPTTIPCALPITLLVTVLEVSLPAEFWHVSVNDFWPATVKDKVSSPDKDYAPVQSPEAVHEVALDVDQVIVKSPEIYIWGAEIDIVIDADGTDGVEGSPPPPPPPPQLEITSKAIKNIDKRSFILRLF